MGRSAASSPLPTPDLLRFPDLAITAAVVPTGVTGRGDAQIPRDGDRVGWYRYGSRPGDARGAAVLIGHRDTRAEGPGALFDLDAALPGTRLQVRSGPRTLDYEVVSLRSIEKAALPDTLFRRDGRHRLVVITCGGPYLPEAGGYQENVVVVARPVSTTAKEGR